MKHLLPDYQQHLALSPEERIEKINSRIWIPYPTAISTINRLRSFINHPKVTRMPNFFLVGDTNNGKSEILEELDSYYKPVVSPEEGVRLDVLKIETPPGGKQSDLYSEILMKLNSAHSLSAIVPKKLYQVRQVLSSLQLKMLIIDELHSAISGSYNSQRGFMISLKFLANDLKIVMVVAGTKEAQRVISTDDQLSNRFEPIELPRWKLNKEFLQLLLSFEQRIALKKQSNLVQKEIAVKIFDLSEGLLGEVSKIIKASASLAIINETEKITPEIIDAINFTPPSVRRKV